MGVIILPSDVRAVNEDIMSTATRVQKTKIVQPIFEYMYTYELDRVLAFIYKESIKDIEILSPSFEPELYEKKKDIETIMSLMDKYEIACPKGVLTHHLDTKNRIELRERVRTFENWVLGYLTYLDLEGLVIESIYYSPTLGFLIKFVGIKPIEDILPNLTRLNDYVQVESKNEKEKSDGFRTCTTLPLKKINKHIKSQSSTAVQWKASAVGYKWACEQLKQGRVRKDIIEEFNKKHKKDPKNYSTREGKELTAAILSHWSKDLK